MENLVRCCIIENPTCPHCTKQAEDVLHVLWKCPSLSSIWDDDPQWNFRHTMIFSDFPQMLSFVLESDCNAEFFAMLTWTIWFGRNKIRCAPLGFPLDQVSQRAFTSLMEFRAVQPKKQSPIARLRTKWKAPPGEMYKINFDGATFSDEGRAGIGLVIRNNQDMVMASMSHNLPLDFRRRLGGSDKCFEGWFGLTGLFWPFNPGFQNLCGTTPMY